MASQENKLPAVFESLSVAAFAWLSVSNLAYFFGMMSQMALRAVLAWEITGSAMALSYISLAMGIPMLLLAPFGGVIADRVERRKLIIIGQCLILLSAVIVYVLLVAGELQLWHLVVTTVVTGAVFPINSPARQAIIANIVPRPLLSNALSLTAASLNLSRVLGPVLVGVLVPWWGLEVAYGVSIVIFVVGLVTLFAIPAAPSQQAIRRTVLGDIADGLRYVVRHRTLRVVFLLGFIPALIGLPFQTLLIVFAEEVWHTGTQGFGYLQAAAGLGAVLGTLIVARHNRQQGTSRLLCASLLAFGVLLVVFSWCPNFYLALLLCVAAMLCANIFATQNTVVVQLLTSDEMRGRMSSIVFVTITLTPLGTVPMAALADRIGAPLAVSLAGGLMIVAVAVAVVASRTLRNLDTLLNESSRDQPDTKQSA